MKIAILSQDAKLYSTQRLKEAGEAQGHEMRVISYLRWKPITVPKLLARQ